MSQHTEIVSHFQDGHHRALGHVDYGKKNEVLSLDSTVRLANGPMRITGWDVRMVLEMLVSTLDVDDDGAGVLR